MASLRKFLVSRCVVLGLAVAGQALAETPALTAVEEHLSSGRAQAALTLAEKELAQHPDDLTLQFVRSRALVALGRNDEARQALERLSERLPRPEVLNNLGWLYANDGLYADAKARFVAALKTDPRYDMIYTNLNSIYAVMASEAYQKALGDSARISAPKPKLHLITELLPLEPTPTTAVTAVNSESAQAPAALDDDEGRLAAQAVIDTAMAWAKAWSARHDEDYLSYYGPDFVTPDRLPREDWNAIRKDRLRAASFIEVALQQPEVRLLDHGTLAILSFTQHYRSNTLRERTRKVLILKNYDGQWRIIVEQSVG